MINSIIDKTHNLNVRIYYEDNPDMSGIVYHANYLRYYERGRSEFLRAAGITHTELQLLEKPLAFAVISMDIAFKKAARIDDLLIIRTKYSKIEGVKININQEIYRKIDNKEELINKADVKIAIIDLGGIHQESPHL